MINKDVNDKDIDNILSENEFNGSEIIDRLEALISSPVDLGSADKLTLISDFQSLIESLGAAAAGGEQAGGNATSDGSTFNSIFSPIDDSLNGIAQTDRWVNLSEEISSIPVDSGNDIGIVNVNIKLEAIDVNIKEGEKAFYKIILTDDVGNPIFTTEDLIVEFTYKYTTASNQDIIEVAKIVIPAGNSEIIFDILTIDDNLTEENEKFSIQINDVINGEQFDTLTVDRTSVETTITDDRGSDNPDVDEDVIFTKEDVPYIITMNNFNAENSNIIAVRITSLPNNGVIKLNGVAVTTNQEISKSDIQSGKLTFIPNNNTDLDASLIFQSNDGTSWSSTYETSVIVLAVADKPTASINVEVKTTTIDISNVNTTNNGFKIKAYNVYENLTTISTFTGTNHNGFGVIGGSTGDAASSEIGYNSSTGKSEKLEIVFDNDVSSIDVKFAWKHAGTNPETAVIKFYRDGVLVDTQTHTGGTDMIDGPFTFKTANGKSFDKVVFGALGTNDDYLINEITFNEVVANTEGVITSQVYDVDISAALIDLDGSETLTIKISNVPEGATFDLANIVNLGNGVWEVVIPQGDKSINYSDIKMTVPSNIKFVDLTITARATETNDNEDGNNFAETNASDATVGAVSESEMINMKEFKYNLVLTIDNSGSMKDKISLAKSAMVNLINKYDELGEVKVLLNVFNAYGDIKGVWVSATKAIELINAISTRGGTNYDDALLKNINALNNNPAPLDGKTISYFVSDGVPTYGMYKSNGTWYRDGNGYDTTDVNDTIVNMWKNLDIDKTYSIGIGTSELNQYMMEISQNPSEDVIVIGDANQLSNRLENTVQELLVEGNVTNNVIGGDGNITIDSITVNNNVYTKDNFPQDGLLLGNNKIKFTFNFETGDYKYYAKSSNFVEQIETFKVNVSDNNGDKESFDVSVNVKVSQNETTNVQNLMGEDIDLTSYVTKNTDIINLENSKIDKLNIEIGDLLIQEDKQLIVKGDLGDKVQLDQVDWANGGKEELNGVNYNVYKGIGTNSTVKLLIEDDIDITSNI